MRSKLIATLMVVAFLVMPAQIAFAQGTMGNWKAVQAIPVNERVIVKQKDGKTIEGQMIEASETNLTISRSSKVVNISRDQIRQVEQSTGKAEKGKWSAIGTGVGAAAGAGIGMTKYRSDRDDYSIYPVMGAIIGAGVGAVSGLVFGASRRQRDVVYYAP